VVKRVKRGQFKHLCVEGEFKYKTFLKEI